MTPARRLFTREIVLSAVFVLGAVALVVGQRYVPRAPEPPAPPLPRIGCSAPIGTVYRASYGWQVGKHYSGVGTAWLCTQGAKPSATEVEWLVQALSERHTKRTGRLWERADIAVHGLQPMPGVSLQDLP